MVNLRARKFTIVMCSALSTSSSKPKGASSSEEICGIAGSCAVLAEWGDDKSREKKEGGKKK
eukprot:4983758-Pleurochrysis_carterae.AAC.4